MTYNIFDDLPTEERDEMVADVQEFLTKRGFTIMGPGSLEEHDRLLRESTFTDAAEIVFNNRHKTPLQLAVQLKNKGNRIRDTAQR